ncbi:uncharacterized protein LOC133031516 [Cannabis sativa]|uniref:uncharacterized protein LOC133031516 n=1 Tax=Cannabis sativa TaxID=3483 RepID=UPI0029C9F257|nr:uncharacterized protein LOC133031516 [Cannabis sativa]
MSLIAWNCHGLGNPWTIQFIKDIVIQKKPIVLFLCETLAKKEAIEKLRLSIGFEGAFSVDAQGKSGGVALLWRDAEEVQLLQFGSNYIDVSVQNRDHGEWRLTGLYGEPNRSLRKRTWDLIQTLKRDNNLPWCIVGDMNNVTSQQDKHGGNLYPNWLIEGFCDTLDECGLYDMELNGYPYTWERGRGTDSWVEARLDRAVVSQGWISKFPLAKLYNLEVSTSDHCPLHLVPVSEPIHHLFHDSANDFSPVINCVPHLVTEDQNALLLEEVTHVEIKKALFQMHPDKAPGPDGMTPSFYQKFWHLVGDDVVRLVQGFFATGEFPSTLNETNIVLIPKKKIPEQMGDLRPISLCNVLYKVVSKVIANRMKSVLPSVISTNQSAFLPGRLISDNIMISYEVMHYMKRKRMGKDGFMAVKLDMSKAYDRVGWAFLEAMLVQMGFNSRFVALIMYCVSTVRYNVTYGGKTMGPIVPGRGIRQGDPISPYLFLVCAEGLSSLLNLFEQRRWLTGCKVARSAPRVSHMLFADDSYVYCKANVSEATHVMHLLQIYEQASGQQLMGMVEAGDDSFYLGLPCILGRNKKAILGFLQEKMKKKIFTWESRFLSKAGKEVLLKSVAQALPCYAMSVFLLTKEICSNLEGLMAKFWWKSQSQAGTKGVNWMSWKRLSRHKNDGGMGFRDLQDYNLAFLGKQGWRLLTNEDSLVSKIYKARFIWKSILEAQGLVQAGARKSIGNGSTVSILLDPWLPDPSNPYVVSDHPGLLNHNVSSLFSAYSKSWDIDVLTDLFTERDKNLILSIQLSEHAITDKWHWSEENSGFYTVKSAYWLLQQATRAAIAVNDQLLFKFLWQLDIPPKVQHFLWRVLVGCLPTKVQLGTKNVNVDLYCPFCNSALETITHVLIECRFAQSCWCVSSVPAGVVNADFNTWFFDLSRTASTAVVKEAAVISWRLWSARNELLWNKKVCSTMDVVRSARVLLDQYISAQSQKTGALLIDNINNVDEQWRKPIVHMVKINVDGAIFQNQNKFGFGCVARDTNGLLLEAISESRLGVVKPVIAETIGIKEALSWIERKQWSNVVIETDALVVVQAINSSFSMPSQFGLLVGDCRTLMSSLNNVSLKFVKRFANRAAHCLARESCFSSDCIFNQHNVSADFKFIVMWLKVFE